MSAGPAAPSGRRRLFVTTALPYANGPFHIGHIMAGVPLAAQLINLLAATLLLLAFAMLTQRRVLSLVNLFAAQGFALALSTAIVAFATHQPHLYGSAALTMKAA